MTLTQGTYIINGGNYPMSPGFVQRPVSQQSENVITGDIRFRWDVLHPKEYKDDLFTIEKYDEDHAYAKPKQLGPTLTSSGIHGQAVQTQGSTQEEVYIDYYAQDYEIIDAGNGFYKIYLPGKKRCLKWNGHNEPVTVVDDAKNDDSLKWVFTNDNGPYETFGEFFVHDTMPNLKDIKVFPHFGLLPLESDSGDRWSNFWEKIDHLNKADKGKAIYKVIFLERHGESESNLLAKLERTKGLDKQNIENFKKDVDRRDPDLTQQGTLDSMNVHAMWETEKNAKIGLPQISYCSPLYRALLTNTITFGVEVYYDTDKTPDLTTVIVENCRELFDVNSSEHRRSKSTIGDICPKFVFEDGFAPDDPFWKKGKNESMKDVRVRVRDVLGKVFSTKGTFVSITTHAGFIEAFLRVVERGPYSTPNGAVIPLVCKYTPSKK